MIGKTERRAEILIELKEKSCVLILLPHLA